jgi:hypothetical protein
VSRRPQQPEPRPEAASLDPLVDFERGTPLETIPMAEDPKDSRPVGFGNPPCENRFKRGDPSPNPSGRPKGTPNPGGFTRRMNKPHTTRALNGEPITMPRNEALMRVVAQGAAGNNHALRKIRDERMALEARLQAEDKTEVAPRPAHWGTEMEVKLRFLLDEKTWPIMEPYMGLISELRKLGAIRFPERSNAFEIAEWVKARLLKPPADP